MLSGTTAVAPKRRFWLVLLKPTHYCDDGYPIRWFRSAIPSNSLACIHGIAEDCAQRNVLGEDVEIEIHAIDEANTRIRPQRIAAAGSAYWLRRSRGFRSRRLRRARCAGRSPRQCRECRPGNSRG